MSMKQRLSFDTIAKKPIIARREAAFLLGVDAITIDAWRRQGRLTGYKLSNSGLQSTYRYKTEEILGILGERA